MAEGYPSLGDVSPTSDTRDMHEDTNGVISEKIRLIKQQRGGIKSAFTKRHKEVIDLLQTTNDTDLIDSEMKNLEQILSRLHEKNNQYKTIVESDSSEFKHAVDYYSEVESLFENLQLQASLWKDTIRPQISDSEHVKPEDSVSQAGSKQSRLSSSVSSSALKLKAKKAALQVKVKALERQQQIKMKQIELQQMEEKLKLEDELAALQAEESVYAEYGSSVHSSRSVKEQVVKQETQSETKYTPPKQDVSNLNPQASEWPYKVPQETNQGHNKITDKGKSVHLTGPLNDMSTDSQLNPDGPNVYPTAHKMQPGSEEKLLYLQQQMIDTMHLPKSEMVEFDGDPLNYWVFMQSFENSVGRTSVHDSVKLNRLLQYCTGKALHVIQCCSVLEPSHGYAEARRLLAERFGNSYTISQAWTRKITEGPPIRPSDKTSLLRFSDDVRSCVMTLKAMGRLSEVDNQIRMVQIVGKLPYYLQGRWRKEAVYCRTMQGQYPDINRLVDFICMAAQEVNDPVFGAQWDAQPSTNTRHPGKFGSSKSQNFVIQSTVHDKMESAQSQKCHMCSKDHALFRCEEFKGLEPTKRLEFTRERKLCFNCFSPSHMAGNCQNSYRCTVDGCSKKHSSLLHSTYRQQAQFNKTNNGQCANKTQTDTKSHNGHISVCNSAGVTGAGSSKIALPIVPVKVRATDGQDFVTTYALLDSGSTNTFCSSDLLKKLGATGLDTKLSVTTLTEENCYGDVVLTKLDVSDVSGRHILRLPVVFSTTNLPTMKDNRATQSDVDKWPHLIDIKLPVLEEVSVSLIIGQDVPTALAPLDIRMGSENEPFATRTIFGWTLNGPIGQSTCGSKTLSYFVTTDVNLERQVEQFWKLNTCESLLDGVPQMSVKDKQVISLWDRTTELTDGHYQMQVPFKTSPPNLPNNYAVAESRLESLGRKLSKDSSMLQRYTSEINDLTDKGFAEKVTIEDQVQDVVWYLPHHAVFSAAKPDKLRVVFDCAASYNGTSLNNEVLQGPDLTNVLIGVLLRFREETIAIMGDVQAMFHQVKVSPSNRDALRFLWWKNGDINQVPEIYRMTVHLFGGVWCPSCATYALRRTSQDFGHEFDPIVAETVLDNFYVDDCLKSVATENQAENLVRNLSCLLRKGGFNLTKWVSNSRQVLESIPNEQRTKTIKDLDLDKESLPTERALGVQWDTESDELGIRTLTKNKPATRRGLLSVLTSIYDPIGFVSPLILQAKKIFQDETKARKSWDEPLGPENLRKWEKWLGDLPHLENFKVPRCTTPSDFGQVIQRQLHHFSDASMDGYGCVSYLRLEGSEGKLASSFLASKSRLAPIKQITIPRLELSAAVLSVKMDRLLRRELRMDIGGSYFWTDSTIVLQYIQSETKRYHTFVANRVATIRDGSFASQWGYVCSVQNPADLASRGATAERLIDNDFWTHGPDFLKMKPDKWPDQKHSTEVPANDSEVKTDFKAYSTQCGPGNEGVVDKLLKRHSTWYSLKRAVAWILRLKTVLLAKVRGKCTETNAKPSKLSVSEIHTAELKIVRELQKQHFGTDIDLLSAGKGLKSSSSLIKLEPILNNDGILCIGGRLQAAPICESAKHPMILPKRHAVVDLVIQECHESVGHSGKEHTLSVLRHRYWVISGRPAVKRVIRRCFHCKCRKAPVGIQRMANLPVDRVSPDKPPFTYVGVDCFGPLMVKRARSEIKRYGCLFTCLSTRAVHIERLDSMDTSSFLDAFRRFECRRGRPEKVRSDNGTNFRGGERELQEAIQNWNQDQIDEHMVQKNIQWEFNPPLASHMGGIWERQIRSVRKVLSSLLSQNHSLNDEGLTTLFCEVEYIINSRPITAVSDDPRDSEALSPNHLLLLRAGPLQPPGKFVSEDIYRRRWKQVQFLADQFWRRWIREYLPNLQFRQKWLKPERNFSEGDLVLLFDENTPRLAWPLGVVTKTFPGKDGLVRSVQVKTKNNSFVRPIDKLCLLEGAQ